MELKTATHCYLKDIQSSINQSIYTVIGKFEKSVKQLIIFCIRIRKSRPNPDFLPPDMSIKIRISYVLYVNKATVQARGQLLQRVNSLVGCLPTRQLICWLLPARQLICRLLPTRQLICRFFIHMCQLISRLLTYACKFHRVQKFQCKLQRVILLF